MRGSISSAHERSKRVHLILTIGDDILVEVRLTRPFSLGGVVVGYRMATSASITFQSAMIASVPSEQSALAPSRLAVGTYRRL